MVSDWLAQAPASAASPTTRYVVPGCMVPRVRVDVRATFATLPLGVQVRGAPSRAARRATRERRGGNSNGPIVCNLTDGLERATGLRRRSDIPADHCVATLQHRPNMEPEVIRASFSLVGLPLRR